MSILTYGLLCPIGHGVMTDKDEWTAKGVAWCPHEEHGGNGRFYRLTEVKTGYYNPNAPRDKSEWQIAKEQQVAARKAAHEEVMMAKKEQIATEQAEAKAPRTRKAKEPRDCKCGCGEQTKGGIFRPGHDARYHSAIAKAQINKEADPAETF